MKNMIGGYEWHYINNEEKFEGLEGNNRYIVCVEKTTPKGSVWHMSMVYWYEEGDELTIYEDNGTPHYFKIDKAGFYIVNEAGKNKCNSLYRLCGVRYWTEIKLPETDPEDILTIEESSN